MYYVVTCDHVDDGNSVLALCTTREIAEDIVKASMLASCEDVENVQEWSDVQRIYEGSFGSYWFIEAVDRLDVHLDSPS